MYKVYYFLQITDGKRIIGGQSFQMLLSVPA